MRHCGVFPIPIPRNSSQLVLSKRIGLLPAIEGVCIGIGAHWPEAIQGRGPDLACLVQIPQTNCAWQRRRGSGSGGPAVVPRRRFKFGQNPGARVHFRTTGGINEHLVLVRAYPGDLSSAFALERDLERLEAYVLFKTAETRADWERACDSDLPKWVTATEEAGHELVTRLEVRATGARQESRVCAACHPHRRLRNRSQHDNLQLDQRDAVESGSRTHQGRAKWYRSR